MNTKTNKANSYLIKEIMEASPAKLVLKVYDFAIAQCKRKDMIKTNEAVTELIFALSYEPADVKNISLQLLALYQFVQEQTRAGKFDLALVVLTDLRNTWATVFEKEKAVV